VSPYQPNPLDTASIVLPPSLLPLMEQIAEHVHDTWATKRLADGWRHGPARDDEHKRHPGLVAYSALPEGEKDYDRKVAEEALKAILLLGYTVGERA
jgi:hypothetical protein